MNAMDYDVYLFTDAETGEEAVVYRCGPTGLRLARQHRRHPPSPPLTINPRATPTLDAAQATRRLGEGCLPFLFFNDPDSGRGALTYRRYDGDIGVVRPAGSTVWHV